jgi:hypothetical protein
MTRWQTAIEAILGHRVPDFESERQPGVWDDCSRRSTAMSAYAWGHPVSDHGEAIIGINGVAGQGGASVAACVSYLQAHDFPLAKWEELTPAAYIARVKAGEVGLTNVWYPDLPPSHREQQGPDLFAHSIFVGGDTAGTFFELDPLGDPLIYQGRWIPESELMTAATDPRAGVSGLVVCILGPAAPASLIGEPMITTPDLTSSYRARIVSATDLLDSPGGKRIAGANVGYTYPYIGTCPNHKAVLVDTAIPYADHTVRHTVLYIAAGAAVIEPVAVPAPVDVKSAVNAALDKAAAAILLEKVA